MSDETVPFTKQLYYFGPGSGLMMDITSRIGAFESEVDYYRETAHLTFTFKTRDGDSLEDRTVRYDLTEKKAIKLGKDIRRIADEIVDDIKRLLISEEIIPVEVEEEWQKKPKEIQSFVYSPGDAAKPVEGTDEEIRAVLVGGTRKIEV